MPIAHIMSATDEHVERARSYIDEYLAKIESPREVAAALGVAYETLRKRFRREVGMPLGQYIRQVRIDRARQLLIETDRPVYEICWAVGFASDSSGIRAFRRATGMTMMEYRRQYQDGKISADRK